MNNNIDIDQSTEKPSRRSDPLLTPRRRTIFILAVLALISIGLIVLPRPAHYYPHVVIDIINGIELDFVLNPRQSTAACQASGNSVMNAIAASCRECKPREVSCLKNPSDEIKNRFNTTPLSVPSARLINGILKFTAPDEKIALQACLESERQAITRGETGKIICYPAGVERHRTPYDLAQIEVKHTLFTILLSIMGIALAGIVISTAICFRINTNKSITPPKFRTFLKLEKFSLAGTDTLILIGTFIALAWPATDDINGWSTIDRNSVISHGLIVLLTIAWFWLLLEHYARRRPFWDELREVLRVLLIMGMVSGAAAFAVGIDSGRYIHIIAWGTNLIALPAGRWIVRKLLDDLGLWQRPVVIVGTGENAREAWLALQSERNMGYSLIGFIDCEQQKNISKNNKLPLTESIKIRNESHPILGMNFIESLPSGVHIIVALESLADDISQKLIQQTLAQNHNIHLIPSIRGLPLFGTQLSHFFSHEVLLLTIQNNLARRGYRWIKRAFDIISASILLVALTPLFTYVAWRIWREDGSPVIFRQPRIAKQSGEFGFLKFRSMTKDADAILARWKAENSPEWQEYVANNFKLKNDPRVLSVGAWIRSTSIDELPQLINVIRGEMSLVGPRPLLARELPDYGDSIYFYRQALPGITGLWQISGRSTTKFVDRINLDQWYVQNWSLWYDIAILVKTINVVFTKHGAH